MVAALERATRDGGRLALVCLNTVDWPAIGGGGSQPGPAAGASYQQDGRCFLLVEDPDRGTGDISAAVRQRLCRADMAAGIAAFPDHAVDPNGLCAAAAAALDAAAPGSYRLAAPPETVVAGPGPAARPGHEQLTLYYQPQVEFAGGHVFGAEALARFSDGSRTRHGASGKTFAIPGVMDESFVFWTLERAVAELKAWRGRGLPDVRLAVNLPLELAESADLPRRIDNLLKASAVPPDCLEIELTEQRPSLNLDAVAGVFEELRTLGVRLALDDFGTGFASLSLFERLPFDTLKIDLSFVAGLDGDPGRDDAEHLVRDIIGLARRRGLTVIAEGVERTAQFDALRRLGCNAYQGYLFSPPVTSPALAKILTAGGRPPERGGKPPLNA